MTAPETRLTATATGNALVVQRQVLRLRLKEQRQLIALQLGPTRGANDGYPRSATMRFMTGRPAMAAKLLAQFAGLLVGARLFGSVGTALAVAKIVRSIGASRSERLTGRTLPQASE